MKLFFIIALISAANAAKPCSMCLTHYVTWSDSCGKMGPDLVLMLEPSGVVHMTGSAFLSTYRCDVLDHELPNDFWPLNDVLCGAVRIVQNGTLRSIGYADSTRFTNVGDCTYWSQRF